MHRRRQRSFTVALVRLVNRPAQAARARVGCRAVVRSSIALFLLAGCGAGAGVPGPSATLRAYGDALSRGDAASAWSLLDDDVREGRSEPRHAELMTANSAELAELGQALGQAASGDGVGARARVALESGETVVLVLEDGAWRIDGGVLDAAGLGTPLDAVASFRRALMRRDLAGIERVLARQTRAEWEDEVRRLVDSTADPEDLTVEVQGNRARVRITGGGWIELVRESGEWRVVDVDEP
jgi:hypothetical protein